MSEVKTTEVFICFTKNSNIHVLEHTINAWAIDGYEPVGIQVEARNYDTQRVVAAEGLAKGDYIIADLGTQPGDEKGVSFHKKGQLKVEVMEREWPQQVQ